MLVSFSTKTSWASMILSSTIAGANNTYLPFFVSDHVRTASVGKIYTVAYPFSYSSYTSSFLLIICVEKIA